MRTAKFLQEIPKILGSSLRTEVEKYLQGKYITNHYDAMPNDNQGIFSLFNSVNNNTCLKKGLNGFHNRERAQ